jgi:hypothetical protein
MRIKLDDTHTLISEVECCWVVKLSKSKNGKMSERRVSGYYRTVEETLHSYFDKHVNANESASIRALRKDIADTHRDIEQWCKALREEEK